MIPQRRPGQTFDAHQAEVAAWLGCDPERMNNDHDRLHASFCKWLGIESLSLRSARGEKLTPIELTLAHMEEETVMYVQRFMVRAGAEVPQC